ncbi:MAG: ABC transporter permease subunit [Bdellovibrionaceae bacterium]|nr:ABC transporter permease subunit [Bdellovibrionales bacterium]MCB9255215.1 ABC transporter permease subunit [Pseudobdellovibrionaceae bacterium]
MRRILFAICFLLCGAGLAKSKAVVSSKIFTESFLLGEVLSQIIDSTGEAKADRKLGLGDTAIVYEGVLNKKVDFYVEYTGTISDSLLNDPSLRSVEEIRTALEKIGLTISEPIGFNNTYAIAMLRKRAESLGIRTMTDLQKHPELVAGFTNSFIERVDCYPMLQTVYGMDFGRVKGLAHGLKIQALLQGEIDVTDLYSTDAKIPKYDIQLVEDDRGAFPKYFAVILTRKEVIEKLPRTWHAMRATLEGRLTEKTIAELNARVEVDGEPIQAVAADFLHLDHKGNTYFDTLWRLTKEHLFLVCLSMLFAIVFGVLLAIVARYYRVLGHFILLFTGMIQTVPSLALLCFLIPLFGIGVVPALVALFLYSLLPIVRSTYVGLVDIDPKLLEVGRALGLRPLQQLRLIEMPLASRQILSGIKTSAIINVGTATLAALIGAGGYGDPIVTGLGLNDLNIILQGAIPAAVLALIVHAAFELLDRVVIPKGLR